MSTAEPAQAVATGTGHPPLRWADAALCALPAALIFAVLWFAWRAPFVDDAYITYRYAVNWAAGLGPVFNPGEFVEGYSCFLWMALLALGSRLGLDPVTFAPRLNLAIGLFTLVALARLCFELETRRPRGFALAATVMTALAAGTTFYAASGMDTPLFALAMVLGAFALARAARSGNYVSALPALALLELSRVEGFLYALVGVAMALWHASGRHDGAARRSALRLSGGVLLFTAVLLMVRHAVYGLWISTTVISKGYATHMLREALAGGGWPAFKRFAWVLRKGVRYETPLLLMGAWIPLALLALRGRRAAPAALCAGAFVALGVALGIWSGGDWMPHDRFLVMVLPMALMGLAWAVDALGRRGPVGAEARALPRHPLAGAALATLALSVWAWLFFRPLFLHPPDAVERAPEFQAQVGRLLRAVPPPVTLATNTAGEIAYYAGPQVYVRDLLGLTDLHNALHGTVWYVRFGRADYDYTFSKPLDVFQTNAWVDMEELVRWCESRPEARERFRFMVTDDWLRASFLVAADTTSAAARALDRQAGTRHLTVDRASLESMRAVFTRWRNQVSGGSLPGSGRSGD